MDDGHSPAMYGMQLFNHTKHSVVANKTAIVAWMCLTVQKLLPAYIVKAVNFL